MSATELDCRGLNCPMPIVRVSRAMAALEEGAVLVVHADDPAFPADIVAWAQLTGHELLEIDGEAACTARLKRVA